MAIRRSMVWRDLMETKNVSMMVQSISSICDGKWQGQGAGMMDDG